MQCVPGFDQREIETLAVEADDEIDRTAKRLKQQQHCGFRRGARHEELPHPERTVFEPGAADEKRVGACTTGQSAGFEIDADGPRPLGSLQMACVMALDFVTCAVSRVRITRR